MQFDTTCSTHFYPVELLSATLKYFSHKCYVIGAFEICLWHKRRRFRPSFHKNSVLCVQCDGPLMSVILLDVFGCFLMSVLTETVNCNTSFPCLLFLSRLNFRFGKDRKYGICTSLHCVRSCFDRVALGAAGEYVWKLLCCNVTNIYTFLTVCGSCKRLVTYLVCSKTARNTAE